MSQSCFFVSGGGGGLVVSRVSYKVVDGYTTSLRLWCTQCFKVCFRGLQ